MRVGLFWRILPVYLIIAGFFMLPLYQRHLAKIKALEAGEKAQTVLASQASSGAVKPQFIQGQPVRIIIPSLGIDLEVVPGHYDGEHTVWTVTSNTANYAQNTSLLNNQKDKTLIYGHWTPQVFGKTTGLAQGDIAYVYTDNSHVFEYEYTDKKIVSPTDTGIFNDFKGEPGLALMTCQGTWAEQRRLMFFKLRESI